MHSYVIHDLCNYLLQLQVFQTFYETGWSHIFFYSVCCLSNNCTHDEIVSVRHDVKHVLYISEVQEKFVKYICIFLTKHLKLKVSEYVLPDSVYLKLIVEYKCQTAYNDVFPDLNYCSLWKMGRKRTTQLFVNPPNYTISLKKRVLCKNTKLLCFSANFILMLWKLFDNYEN